MEEIQSTIDREKECTMASTPFLFCGPCETRKSHRQANVWCAVCREGLCKECEDLHQASKLSKDHKTFDDTLYPLLKPFLRDLLSECSEHKRRLDFFCHTHSLPCCVTCVTDKHRQCSIKPVDDDAQTPRLSKSYKNLEEDMVSLLERIENFKIVKTNDLKILNKQKEAIEADVKEMRKTIDAHLDKLEKTVLEDLKMTEQRHSLDIAQLLFEIDTKKQIVINIQTIANCVKQLPVGAQTMLATKKVAETFLTEKHLLEPLMTEKEQDNVKLQFHFHDKIKSFVTDIKSFGHVNKPDRSSTKSDQISSRNSKPATPVIQKKEEPKMVRTLEPTDPTRVSLKYIKKFKSSKRKSKAPVDLRGCVLLADDKMLFADWSDNKKLMMFNIDGSHNKDVGVIGKPYDITQLDGERVAVSFPEDSVIQIFDKLTNSYPIYQNIKMAGQCWGIFYCNSKLFVGCNGHKIQIMNLSGNVEKTIPTKVNTVYCVNADSDYVYYCDEVNNSVYCCDFDGNEIWKFRDPSLKYPCSVAFSSSGYLYVVGSISQNVFVISGDGQQSKMLLSKQDGLDGPSSIYFDVKANRLLVVIASFKGQANLYDVITKPRSLNL